MYSNLVYVPPIHPYRKYPSWVFIGSLYRSYISKRYSKSNMLLDFFGIIYVVGFMFLIPSQWSYLLKIYTLGLWVVVEEQINDPITRSKPTDTISGSPAVITLAPIWRIILFWCFHLTTFFSFFWSVINESLVIMAYIQTPEGFRLGL